MTSQYLITEPPLQVLPTLARTLGFHESIVLQQIHYWLKLPFSRHLINSSYWVRYTPERWENQFPFWDTKTIRRILKNLEKKGLLACHQLRASDKAKYYTINYKALKKILSSPKSKLKITTLSPTYDHANFDAINFADSKEKNI